MSVRLRTFIASLLITITATSSNIGPSELESFCPVNPDIPTRADTSIGEYQFGYEPVDAEYIVTFKTHYPPNERYLILTIYMDHILGTNKIWTIIPRHRDNPFYTQPTDFDVIKVLTPNAYKLLSPPPPHFAIKSIVPQMRITRKLLTGYHHDHEEADDNLITDDLYHPYDLTSHSDDFDFLNHDLPSHNLSSEKENNTTSYQSIKSRKGMSLSYFWHSVHRSKNKRLLGTFSKQVTTLLGADVLWKLGVTGKGVRVGVFDTGIATSQGPGLDTQRKSQFGSNVADVTDWTFEARGARDSLGHGTFVCGVVAGTSTECPGLAPDAQLYVFRVFTDGQISYTSWYLDAFNYAILKRIHILNLSIGGPDFLDKPFIDKVWELSANRMIMISSIGNDGPIAGSLNNPADMIDVIGVGGVTYDDRLASFSSRGMTTWELPTGYGRVKPDVLTYGIVQGPGLNGGCRVLSGTSVASPVVAGAVALLLSSIMERNEPDPISSLKFDNDTYNRPLDIPMSFNVALLKQVLMAGATRLPGLSMFDQGHGKMDLLKSYAILRAYQGTTTPSLDPSPIKDQHYSTVVASFDPPYLDAAGASECPYMWPYCSQPIYHTGMPLIANVTILNPMGLTGKIVGKPTWHPYLRENGKYLDIHISHSPILWPWSGWMALHVRVYKGTPAQWEGIAAGQINLTIESPPAPSSDLSNYDFGPRFTQASFPVRIKIIRKPVPQKRILWDQFHNLNYPPGYCPRDNLLLKDDPMDWNGDHLHTNFRALYNHLRRSGYFVEVLGAPYTCFDASNYGTLLVVDPEEEFWPEERLKLTKDVAQGLSVILMAEWYNTTVMRKIKFYDENTRHWWIPDTGGSNVPALNELLQPWNISLGDRVYEGDFAIGSQLVSYVSGTSLTNFPNDPSAIIIAPTLKDQGHSVITESRYSKVERTVPVLGMYQTKKSDYPSSHFTDLPSIKSLSPGRIVVYGDSNCVDSQKLVRDCFWMLDDFLTYTMTGKVTPILHTNSDKVHFEHAHSPPNKQSLEFFMHDTIATQPQEEVVRMKGNKLFRYSKVLAPWAGSILGHENDGVVPHPHKNLMNSTRDIPHIKDEILIPAITITTNLPSLLELRPIPTCSHTTLHSLSTNKILDSLSPYHVSQGRPLDHRYVYQLSRIRSYSSFLTGYIDQRALAVAQNAIKAATEALSVPINPTRQNIGQHSFKEEPTILEQPVVFSRQSYGREIVSSLVIFVVALITVILAIVGLRTFIVRPDPMSQKFSRAGVSSGGELKRGGKSVVPHKPIKGGGGPLITTPVNSTAGHKKGRRVSTSTTLSSTGPTASIPYKSIK